MIFVNFIVIVITVSGKKNTFVLLQNEGMNFQATQHQGPEDQKSE